MAKPHSTKFPVSQQLDKEKQRNNDEEVNETRLEDYHSKTNKKNYKLLFKKIIKKLTIFRLVKLIASNQFLNSFKQAESTFRVKSAVLASVKCDTSAHIG